MMDYRFDDVNFGVIDLVKVGKVSVDVIDNRTNAETNLQMLLVLDGYDYRDRVRSICRDLGYSVVLIGEPKTGKLDLNELEYLD